jgi:Arc/MetJ-type ribon-helix-helix transcriptional regulator
MAKTTSVDVSEDVARCAQALVAAGRVASIDEVIQVGVAVVEKRGREWLEYARAQAVAGFAELDHGEGGVRGTPDEVMTHVRAEVAARLANQAPK